MLKRIGFLCLFLLKLAAAPSAVRAQTFDTTATTAQPIEPEDLVVRHDLSGPRVGFTLQPDGGPRSQFGWHLEKQASTGRDGPWFVVETILLAGGVEENKGFVPNGTLIFGMRMPNGTEFGIGPSVTLAGVGELKSSVVLAAGQSFRVGGVRVPVNVALATDKDGQRLSFVTGWAIRESTTGATR